MNEPSDLLEMLSFPYYVHKQAQLLNPVQSISWNRVALLGYIDILLYAKDLLPSTGFQRKIRLLYEHYPSLAKNHPSLGDLDGFFRAFNRIDKDQTDQVAIIALKWHSTVQTIEKVCLDIAARRCNFSDPAQLNEAIQCLLFQMQTEATLPQFNEFFEEQQEEIRRLVELKKYPSSIFQKIKFKHQFLGVFQTDKQPVQFLIKQQQEIQDIISNMSKAFFRLINIINLELPEPDRSVKVGPSLQNFSTPQDYRLLISFAYDGNDESEYERGLLSKLRNLLSKKN